MLTLTEIVDDSAGTGSPVHVNLRNLACIKPRFKRDAGGRRYEVPGAVLVMIGPSGPACRIEVFENHEDIVIENQGRVYRVGGAK